MRIYFDNASTTPIYNEVLECMNDISLKCFGNPSSIHQYGRKARVIVEDARTSICNYLKALPAQLFFTSGGTEANNTVINSCITYLNTKHIITSALEHQSVLRPLQEYQKQDKVSVDLVKTDSKGRINLKHLEELIKNKSNVLVMLMHANNEIGNLLPVKEVSKICRKHNALLHCDMVQTIGHYNIDFNTIDVDFASASAHKFHGPKGIGLLYAKQQNAAIYPLLYGGRQERNIRAGTENVAAIAGFAKTIQLAYENLTEDQQKIASLKKQMIEQLSRINNIQFAGECQNRGHYGIVHALFPLTAKTKLLPINLDINNIAISQGSACTSGAQSQSHVIKALGIDKNISNIRISFSKFNTSDEINYFVDKLCQYI